MTKDEKLILEQGNDLFSAKISNQISTESDSEQRKKLKYFLKKVITAGETLEAIKTEEELFEEEKKEVEQLKKVENEVE